MASKKASISINVIADAARAKAGLAEAERAAGSLDTQFKNLAKTAVNAFAAREIVNFGKEAIGAASDLAESANAVAVTFGDAASGIMKLGEEASKTVGLSAKDFNAFAVQFAGFTQQLTTADQDIVDVTETLTTRIADFASVMNLDIPDAATKFRQALSGETEGMKQFGIDVSAAAVQSYALANGITDSAASMTEAEKVQARYGLIMEETAKMSGDFANTSDGLANQQRILAAEMENVKATVGQAMVPALQAVMGAVGPVVDAFTALPDGMQQTIVLAGTGAVGFRAFSNTLQGFGVAAKTANTSLGLLGITLGGAILAYQSIAGHKERVTEITNELVAALNDETRSTEEAAKATLVNKFATGELGDAMDELGLTAGEVADAILGDEYAQRRLNDTLDEAAIQAYDTGGRFEWLTEKLFGNEDAATVVAQAVDESTEAYAAARRETERLAEEQERAALTSTYSAHALDELNTIAAASADSVSDLTINVIDLDDQINQFGFSVKQAGYELDAFYGRLAAEEELARFSEELDTIMGELSGLTEGTDEYADKWREANLLVAGLSENAKRIPKALELQLVMSGDFARLERILNLAATPDTYNVPAQEELAFLGGLSQSPSGIVNTYNITVNAGIGTDGNEVGRQIVESVNRYYASGGELIGTGPR
jgi:hypothetical protein